MKRLLALAACCVLSACTIPGVGTGVGPSGLPACGRLPAQALDTISLINDGGPYPYPVNDDKRFGNYEGHLPSQARDYYREYTVDTPGVNHRGARRIVTGGGGDGVVDEWFYTDDHYETFCEISASEVTASEVEGK